MEATMEATMAERIGEFLDDAAVESLKRIANQIKTGPKAWLDDLRAARILLLSGYESLSENDRNWLNDVIGDASHDERRNLREGLECGPRPLWYDYDRQTWID